MIIPNLKFEYTQDGYIIKIDPPLVMPLEHINELTKEVQKYKDEAQSYILERYNWDDVVTRTLSLYQKN